MSGCRCSHSLRATQVRADLSVPAAVTVTVEPANTDDWEVVEQNAEYLEDQILTQVLPSRTLLCHPSSSCERSTL